LASTFSGKNLAEAIKNSASFFTTLSFLVGKKVQGKNVSDAEVRKFMQDTIQTVGKVAPVFIVALTGPWGAVVMALVSGFIDAFFAPEKTLTQQMDIIANRVYFKHKYNEVKGKLTHFVQTTAFDLAQTSNDPKTHPQNRVNLLLKVEREMRTHLLMDVFYEACFREKTGKSDCKTWNEKLTYPFGEMFALMYLNTCTEIMMLDPDREHEMLVKIREGAYMFHLLLGNAHSAYVMKRKSYLHAPQRSCGLNYNWFTRTCMVSDGQDCLFSNDPDGCKKDGKSQPKDECLAKPGKGLKYACDVITHYCKIPGRKEAKVNMIFGWKLYSFRMKDHMWRRTESCYKRYKKEIHDGLAEFYDSLTGIMKIALNATCPSGYLVRFSKTQGDLCSDGPPVGCKKVGGGKTVWKSGPKEGQPCRMLTGEAFDFPMFSQLYSDELPPEGDELDADMVPPGRSALVQAPLGLAAAAVAGAVMALAWRRRSPRPSLCSTGKGPSSIEDAQRLIAA